MEKKEYVSPEIKTLIFRSEIMLNTISNDEDDIPPSANERRNVSSSSRSLWGDSGRKESLW